MMSRTHRERSRERQRQRALQGNKWECYEVSCLTTCDRPAPSCSSYSTDDCFYVEAIISFPGSDFMKERIEIEYDD